jgi:hypothetical protein
MQFVGSSIKDGSLDQGVDDSDGLAHPETQIKIWISAVKLRNLNFLLYRKRKEIQKSRK